MVAELTSDTMTQGIEEIVASIFEHMLGLVTRPSCLEAGRYALREVHSSVKLAGGWQGMVSIECTCLQARQFAARFLSLPERQIDDQIAHDVLGELTNMIAGNLKPLFSSDIKLSVAAVFPGKDEVVESNHQNLKELLFSCAIGNFAVKVLTVRADSSNPCCPRL